jgi:GNAT superfamily N-acetyltransferase
MAAPNSYTLGVLNWEREQAIAIMLARAFADDPLVMAICAGSMAERLRRMQWNFRIAVRSHCLAAQPGWTMDAPDAAPVAAVLVTRPHAQVDIGADLLFAVRGLLHLGMSAGMRGLHASRIIAAHTPREPFTYVRTLGVDPDLHGRGVGSRLVDQVIRTAPVSLPLYLETAKARNLTFYARHGFERIGEFRCLGVPVWRLLRPPAAQDPAPLQ